jgi:L-alanine-DL-glutamate epimerase-like enolase superfamily enzyme
MMQGSTTESGGMRGQSGKSSRSMTVSAFDQDTKPIILRRIEVWVYRIPLDRPLIASFGVLRSRPAVFVRIEDHDGCFGFGEIFANWPAAGAEHRARLLIEDISHLVIGQNFASPSAMQRELEQRTRIRALQCGEPGPFRQCIAGLDQAALDLVARRADRSVARFLRDDAPTSVPVYASGVHYDDADEFAPTLARDGVRNVKVKVGFGRERDLDGVARARKAFVNIDRLMLDANQAWSPGQAAQMCADLASFDPFWMEEPIAADHRSEIWRDLAMQAPMPLAGGENIAGAEDFTTAINLGALKVIQPDIAKWGGISGCLVVARHALEKGRTFCPHFLGGGIGLHASAHFLASAGGDGLLEVDINPNQLRDAFLPAGTLENGHFMLSNRVGYGIDIIPDGLLVYQTLKLESH